MTWILLSHQSDITHYYLSTKDVTNTVSILDVVIVSVTKEQQPFLVFLGAIAGIVDQPMQNFQRNWEMQSSAGSKAKGVISGVGKGIVGVFTKPIGGAAELVSQTGYGEFRMVKDNSMLNESVTVFSFVGRFHTLCCRAFFVENQWLKCLSSNFDLFWIL